MSDFIIPDWDKDDDQIGFVEADKYVVSHLFKGLAPFKPTHKISNSYGTFYPSGHYIINKGFLFSANFPAINTFNTRKPAATHDFFYSLMKDGYLPKSYRDSVDQYFHHMLIATGMVDYRAFYWYQAVRIAGGKVLDSEKPKTQWSPKPPEYQKQPKFGMA